MALIGALGLAVFMSVGSGGLTDSASAAPSTITVDQCNSSNNGGGRGMDCEVTVYNYYDIAADLGRSSTVTVACDGPANTVPLPFCITTVIPSNSLVKNVKQCDGAANGGGASLKCRVHIKNYFVGAFPSIPASVDQCVGSGDTGTAPTLVCGPTRTDGPGSAIVQCNGSGNGGTASMIVTCGYGASTESSAYIVTVDQCSGSANGGGAIVVCSTDMQNLATLDYLTSDVNDVGGPAGTTTSGVFTPNPVTVNAAAAPDAPELAATGAAIGSVPLYAGMALLLGGSILCFVAAARIRKLELYL